MFSLAMVMDCSVCFYVELPENPQGNRAMRPNILQPSLFVNNNKRTTSKLAKSCLFRSASLNFMAILHQRCHEDDLQSAWERWAESPPKKHDADLRLRRSSGG